MLCTERHSARVLKITNDGLIRSGTGWFFTVILLGIRRRHMATVGVKRLISIYLTECNISTSVLLNGRAEIHLQALTTTVVT